MKIMNDDLTKIVSPSLTYHQVFYNFPNPFNDIADSYYGMVGMMF